MTKIPIAISYDFDGTLAAGNMQEYEFIPGVGMTTPKFWKEVSRLAEAEQADNILMYMMLMLQEAEKAKVPVRRSDITNFGKGVKLFQGVQDWFQRINAYAASKGAKVDHFIISSGLREMIEGTPISKEFSKIFGSSFFYDHNTVAKWPALAINYTTKTQYLFRINKGVLNVHDHKAVNKYLDHNDRPVPFRNMIFVGDGETDVPCFRLVKEQGGHSIAVYKPSTKGAKTRAQGLVEDGRVNMFTPADYRDGKKLDRSVKAIIDKIVSEVEVEKLSA